MNALPTKGNLRMIEAIERERHEPWRNFTPGQRVKVAEKASLNDDGFRGMLGRFVRYSNYGYAVVIFDGGNHADLLHPESLEPTNEPRKPLVVPQLQGGR